MAGKRQHFVPQFLLKGFASAKSERSNFTWVYRKDRIPFETNIENIGVERFFYTDGEDKLLDDIITNLEGNFSAIIAKARSSPVGEFSKDGLPEFFAHVEIRTRHLRQNFLKSGGYLINRLLDFVGDGERFLPFLSKKLEQDPSMLRNAVLKELRKRNLPEQIEGTFIDLIKPLMPIFFERIKLQLPEIANNLKAGLPKTLENSAKAGHIKALKENPSPKVKIQGYEQLTFSILEINNQDMIFGDSIIIFHIDGPKKFKPFLDGDILKAVLLPLSPTKMLVGAKQPYDFQEQEIKRAVARCSLEFFISSAATIEGDLLANEIGIDADLLSQTQLEEILGETMSNQGFS